jgi:hypothetical protein
MDLLFQWLQQQHPQEPSDQTNKRQVIVISPGKIGMTADICCFNTSHLLPKKTSKETTGGGAAAEKLPSDSLLPSHILSTYQSHVTFSQVFIGSSSAPPATAPAPSSPPSSLHSMNTGMLYILQPNHTTTHTNCAVINLISAQHWREKLLQDPAFKDHILSGGGGSTEDHLLSALPTTSSLMNSHEENSLHLLFSQLPVYLLTSKGLKSFRHYLVEGHEATAMTSGGGGSSDVTRRTMRKSRRRVPYEVQLIWKVIEELLWRFHAAAAMTTGSSSSSSAADASHASNYGSGADRGTDGDATTGGVMVMSSSQMTAATTTFTPTILSLFNSLETICRRCDILFQYLFTQYTQSLLPKYISLSISSSFQTFSSSPSSSQITPELSIPTPHSSSPSPSSLVTLLTSLYLTLISLLPHSYRPLFPCPPNPLLLSCLWAHFLQVITPLTSLHLLAEDRQGTVTAHEIVTQLLPQKPELFFQLCRLLMICQGLYGTVREEMEGEE